MQTTTTFLLHFRAGHHGPSNPSLDVASPYFQSLKRIALQLVHSQCQLTQLRFSKLHSRHVLLGCCVWAIVTYDQQPAASGRIHWSPFPRVLRTYWPCTLVTYQHYLVLPCSADQAFVHIAPFFRVSMIPASPCIRWSVLRLSRLTQRVNHSQNFTISISSLRLTEGDVLFFD